MRTEKAYRETGQRAADAGEKQVMMTAMAAQFAAQAFEQRVANVRNHLTQAVTELDRIVARALEGPDAEAALRAAERIITNVTWALANAQIGYLVSDAHRLDQAHAGLCEAMGDAEVARLEAEEAT